MVTCPSIYYCKFYMQNGQVSLKPRTARKEGRQLAEIKFSSNLISANHSWLLPFIFSSTSDTLSAVRCRSRPASQRWAACRGRSGCSGSAPPGCRPSSGAEMGWIICDVQRGAKKFLHVWISRLPPDHKPRAANAQPISPDGTCVTELSKVFFARPCII